MNELTLLREAGPEAPPLRPAALSAARAALLDEIDTAAAGRASRFRLPSARVQVRTGVGLVTVAAAWAAAVVIAAPEPLGPPSAGVALVAFEPATFPLSLEPRPAGWVASFSADPGGIRHAGYRSADGEDGVHIRVSPDEPEQYDVAYTVDVPVDGRDAQLVRGDDRTCAGPGPECVEERIPYLHLVFEHSDDQWVQLEGFGRFGDRDALVELAADLVDRPQPVPLQLHLAPAGWSVQAYKDDRILTLVNDEHEQQDLTVHVPLPEDVVALDQLRSRLTAPVGPMIPAEVNGRPAGLVLTDTGWIQRYWHLQAEFPDGTTFVVQAPEAFTQEQVLALAEEVSYRP